MKKIILLILVIFTSCVAKKTTTEYKERIVKDTLIINKERIVTQQVIDTLVVESPCDSLGNLKDFVKEIRTPIAKVSLKSVKGAIEVSVNIDSIVDQRISKYRKSYNKEVHTKEVEVVRYKYPLWLILSLVVSIIVNLFLLKSRLFF
tara:strand:+ start:429 stop:869 length:441 start_codon:yes stop_codon:yes gene_type:complete